MGRNQARFPKPPGRPQLELGHHPFRRHIARTRDYDVHMVRSRVDGAKFPTTQVTMIGDRLLNGSSRLVVQNIRNMQQGLSFAITALGTRWNQRRSERVVLPVNGTAIIAMQPGSMAGPSQKVCQRRRYLDRSIPRVVPDCPLASRSRLVPLRSRLVPSRSMLVRSSRSPVVPLRSRIAQDDPTNRARVRFTSRERKASG